MTTGFLADASVAGLWNSLLYPMLRLLLGLMAGILVANILESLHWVQHLARLSNPVAKGAHLGVSAQAAFATAFISPHAATALLSSAYQEKKISEQELFLASLFSGFPASLVHLPTLFFLFFPVLGFSALIYLFLSLFSAFLRTLGVFFLSRVLLPLPEEKQLHAVTLQNVSFKDALKKAWVRFRRRCPKLFLFSVPVYLLMYALQVYGAFDAIEKVLAGHPLLTTILSPQAAGIVILHLLAELGSALSAAASLMATGGLTDTEVIMALLVGNILSTPVRALRHQLPSYAGFFTPILGLRLVLANQLLRVISMAVVTACYYFWIR